MNAQPSPPVWRGALLALALAAAGAHAQVYKCTAGGRVSFQERPCGGGQHGTTARAEKPAWPWQGLKARMSVQQVRQAMPGTVQGDGARLVNGASQQLALPSVALAGTPGYEVGYWFLDDGLYQISAQQPGMTRGNDPVRAEWQRLESVLRREWGAPQAGPGLSQGAAGLSGHLEWALPNGDAAWMLVLPITSQTAALSVGYRPSGRPAPPPPAARP